MQNSQALLLLLGIKGRGLPLLGTDPTPSPVVLGVCTGGRGGVKAMAAQLRVCCASRCAELRANEGDARLTAT